MLASVALLFLKLGTLGFGGPAAHIGMMRQEVVERRRWRSETEFLDLLGAANLIPGPSSTELAIHIGFRQCGWPELAGCRCVLHSARCLHGDGYRLGVRALSLHAASGGLDVRHQTSSCRDCARRALEPVPRLSQIVDLARRGGGCCFSNGRRRCNRSSLCYCLARR